MRNTPGWLVGVAVLGLTSSAYAQSANEKAAADALFSEAQKLGESGHLAEACLKYAESERLDPQLGTLLYLADCYEKTGRTASAWASFREAAELAARRSDSREGVAKERAAALDPKLSRLAIVVPPEADLPELRVTRGALDVGRGLWNSEVPVDPGKFRITAQAPQHATATYDVDVAEAGKSYRVTLTPLVVEAPKAAAPPPPPAPVAPPPPKPEAPPASSGSPLRTFGFIATGVGVLGVAAGTVFALLGKNAFEKTEKICPTNLNCTPADKTNYASFYGDGEQFATGARVAFVGGGVLLVGGIVMVIAAPSSASSPPASSAMASLSRVAIAPTAHGAQLSWSGAW